MVARTLGGIARTSLSERTRHDFAGCDVGLPTHAIFTGGGNRQRRRIHGAVGASRRNFIPSPRDLNTWDKTDVTVTTNVEANPFDGLTTVDQAVFAAVANARLTLNIPDLVPVNGDVLRISFDCWSASATTLNVSPLSTPSFTEYYWEDVVAIRAGWGRYTVVMPVSGITTDTGLRMYLITRDSVARTLKFDRIDLRQNDDSIRWFIEGTTTDYPRRTLNGNGTTPQYGDGGWWATDGTADLLPSNVLGPTGYPMSKLARRTAGDGCYAYQSGLTFIAGEKYARRIVAQADDDAGDVVFVEMATSLGVYIANGYINVRTGAVPAVSNGTIVLIGRIGKQFIFEMRGTAPASVSTGYCSWIVPFAGPVGSGVLFGCDQVEHGEICTAHMHSALGQYGSSVTPPFGELVDVDSGDPRVQYGEHGFGIGIDIAGPTDAEALRFTDMAGFGLNQDAWTIIVEATEPAIDPTGYPMILRMTGPGGAIATINKQQDGRIEFQIYDGVTNVARQIAAGTPGTMRRYALGYDRASQTMRFAASDVAPADATDASLGTLTNFSVTQLASSDGFWWANNITAKVEVFKRLLLAEEFTKEVAL